MGHVFLLNKEGGPFPQLLSTKKTGCSVEVWGGRGIGNLAVVVSAAPEHCESVSNLPWRRSTGSWTKGKRKNMTLTVRRDPRNTAGTEHKGGVKWHRGHLHGQTSYIWWGIGGELSWAVLCNLLQTQRLGAWSLVAPETQLASLWCCFFPLFSRWNPSYA